jgi:iron only hydrogenase large subunit-like protein
MIQGEREGVNPVDVLLTFDGMEEVLNNLKSSTTPKEEIKEEAKDGDE